VARFDRITWTPSGELDHRLRAVPVVEEKRQSIRSSVLGSGTLACHRCDAPIAPGPHPLLLSDMLRCPFCAAEGRTRDFLSLDMPTRPARVVLRVVRRASAA
jgi:hypothetical protein